MIYLEYTRTDTINFLQDVPFLDIFIKMESEKNSNRQPLQRQGHSLSLGRSTTWQCTSAKLQRLKTPWILWNFMAVYGFEDMCLEDFRDFVGCSWISLEFNEILMEFDGVSMWVSMEYTTSNRG